MRSYEELRQILPSQPTVPLQSALCRAIHLKWLLEKGDDFDVLFVGGASSAGARFTPPNGPRSLYLAQERSTADDEANQEFFDSITGNDAPPATILFTVSVSLSNLIDLNAPSIQNALQTKFAELTAPWPPYQMRGNEAPTQTLGRAAFDSGIAGLIYPSTATRRLQRPTLGGCLVIFPDRFKAGDFVEVSEPEKYRKRLP